MPSQLDHGPGNAFTVDFLARLDELAEPDGAHEADVAGPWRIQPVPYRGGSGFALLREWESLEAGDAPYAVFCRRELALLAAAVLPATGREALFRLGTEPDAHGFPLVALVALTEERSAPGAPPGNPVGHLRDFDEALADGLRLAAALVRSPLALARLLEAAGQVALEQAGRILDRDIRHAIQ